jgi:hypothetical protein
MSSPRLFVCLSLTLALFLVGAVAQTSPALDHVQHPYAGLREGEMGGLDWTDYDSLSEVKSLNVNKSLWRGHLKRPKTVASGDNVPVIEPLAAILDEYRQSMRNPQAVPVFVSDDGSLLDLDKLGTR